MNLNDIRSTLFSDAFYPKDSEEIKKIIHKLEQNIQLPKIDGKIYGAIVPHAGYVYSGYCALHIYKFQQFFFAS
jgi:AmmeMemoRadiSam system protein B